MYLRRGLTVLYRVSIKSFPDYKHLLQENYLYMLELYVPHNPLPIPEDPS